jgi:uncharacterized integral membrane protein
MSAGLLALTAARITADMPYMDVTFIDGVLLLILIAVFASQIKYQTGLTRSASGLALLCVIYPSYQFVSHFVFGYGGAYFMATLYLSVAFRVALVGLIIMSMASSVKIQKEKAEAELTASATDRFEDKY